MNKKSITIPESLFKQLEMVQRDSHFASVEDYVTFVLQDHLEKNKVLKTDEIDEEQAIQNRLKNLGYL